MDKTKTLKAVVVRPVLFASIEDINGDLQDIQEFVGGHIEQLCPWEDDVALICNEDGKNKGLMPNRALYDDSKKMIDIIAGPFLIVGLGEENFRSLTEEEAEKYYNEFRKPEFWVKK